MTKGNHMFPIRHPRVVSNSMAAEDIDIDIDTMEQILIRSDVKDLLRWKGVCKSWYSLISTPYFTESHSKQHAYNNNNDTERITGIGSDSSFLAKNRLVVVGSANGLVCVSPEGLQLVVVNPCTTQTIKILQTPPEPLPESNRRWDMVWGFGYDPSNNDYKILLGLVKKKKERSRYTTRFYLLSLKTCIWKFIEELDYVKSWRDSVSGILCDGALHWLMMNNETEELAILSFNLSREEFTKPQLPDGHPAKRDMRDTLCTLGVMKESLNLYECKSGSTKTWVLRNDKISRKQSWVLLPQNYVTKCVDVYVMLDNYSIEPHDVLSDNPTWINAPIYVPSSLVSPQVNMDFSTKSIDVAANFFIAKNRKSFSKMRKLAWERSIMLY